MTAAETREKTAFGRVSRLRGVLFENLTRAASAVALVALFLLLAFTVRDAVQPFTADPEWYLLLSGTFVVPTLAVAWYCWNRPRTASVAVRATGATVAGLALAAVLVLWLGGQLALLVVVAVIIPTAATFVGLRRRRRAVAVGVGTVAVIVAGGGIGSILSFFIGPQATTVFAVAVGLPAAALARFFLARPALASVGARALGAAVAGVTTAGGGLTVALFLGAWPGEGTVGVLALGGVIGVAGYGVRVYGQDGKGALGLFAPFVLFAGALGGYLFHREFVIVAWLVPSLYGVTAGLPALGYAATVLRGEEGTVGLTLPIVTGLGIVTATGFHARYVVKAPTAAVTFALAVGLGLGGYAFYIVARERSIAHSAIEAAESRGDGGTHFQGLAVPLVAGSGLLAGVAAAREFGITGPETWLDLAFLTNGSHYQPELTGIHPALVGSLYLMFVVTFVAFPVGVGAAIYLEEYAPENRLTRLLEINIANLAGVPSVVYGLLGVAVFIRFGGLSLGAVVAGGFTLSLLILPIVIVTSQEAIRAVPDSLREASYGMGATRWQTIRKVVLPRALPGILTSTILALGRAVGETAPLIMVGLAPIGGIPDSLAEQGTAMPLQVFAWALDARELFRDHVAAAGALTLLVTLVALNGVAIVIRNRYQRDQ